MRCCNTHTALAIRATISYKDHFVLPSSLPPPPTPPPFLMKLVYVFQSSPQCSNLKEIRKCVGSSSRVITILMSNPSPLCSLPLPLLLLSWSNFRSSHSCFTRHNTIQHERREVDVSGGGISPTHPRILVML